MMRNEALRLQSVFEGAITPDAAGERVVHRILQTLMDGMPLIVALLDVDGTILYVNRTFAEKHNLTRDQCIGKQVWEVAAGVPQQQVEDDRAYVLAHKRPVVKEAMAVTAHAEIPYHLNLCPIFDDAGNVVALLAIVENLKSIRDIEFSAFHDSLTGLANRRLLEDRMAQNILQVKREGGDFAVCFIDLNGFKQINDQYGHAVGDELLKVVARRISACLRGADTLARYGGDEFVAILRGKPESGEVLRIMNRIAVAASDRIFIQGEEFFISVSMGFASYPSDGDTAEAVMALADSRMYDAKAAHYKAQG